MIFCAQCGHPMEEGKKFCNKCGAPMQQQASVPLTPPTSEKEPPQAAAEAFAAMGETMILQEAAAPNQAPVTEAPISKEIPAQEPAVPPVRFQEQSAAAPEKPKRKLFPIIFFPILGLCLTVLLILCAPRIGRLVWGIAHNDDDSYSDIYMEETAPTTNLPTATPTTQAPATESTLSLEEKMYAEAYRLMSEECYDDARELFAVLGSYNDSVSLRQKCDFEIAHNHLKQNAAQTAIKIMFDTGKELYEAGTYHIDLSDGYYIEIEPSNPNFGSQHYISVELSRVIYVAFDSQGNIIEWGKYHSESNGYELGDDDVFEYIF